MTYSVDALFPSDGATGPLPLRLLPGELQTPGLDGSKFAPYEMADLTIPSWLQLAARLGDGKHRKLRNRFRKYMFLGGQEE